MTEDKEIKDLVNKMFMEKAPENFEDALLSKLDAIIEKPLPVYESIIPRKFWILLFGALVAGILAIQFFTTPINIQATYIQSFFNVVRSISLTWTLVPLVPLFLYFVDIYREYRFNLKYHLN